MRTKKDIEIAAGQKIEIPAHEQGVLVAVYALPSARKLKDSLFCFSLNFPGIAENKTHAIAFSHYEKI